MFKTVNPKQNFSDLENDITKFWKANSIFEKSVSQKDVNNRYVFYDGPPFITGTPHYGSLLPSIAKDVIPRYQTMNGKRVERVWGWDCHGLPIETKVEKELNIKVRRDIEKYGIQHFVDQCYKYTRNTSAEWRWYIDKIGRWVDLDNSYKTMDQDYMESVIQVFKQLWEKDLVYEGVRTSLYCTRCGTPISNFEIAMDNSYEDMEDPAVTIKFPVKDEGEFKGASILAWTTTPWTLPANKALVVDPKEDYILARVQRLDSELELAWLVAEMPKDLNKLKKSQITQAYLEDFRDDTGMELKDVRIRKQDDKFQMTLKYFAGDSKETGQVIEKTEEITKEKFIELIKKATNKVVKTRYYIPLADNLTAELDVYQNNLAGLNVLEVEFPSVRKAETFTAPDWFGKEVTDSEGIYPPKIADLTLEQVRKINEAYIQKEHNFSENSVSEMVILAKKRAEHTLGKMDFEIMKEFKGEKLLDLSYDPPFSFIQGNEKEHKVYSYKGMVHMEEGTGIVHSAPGFGEIDTDMGKAHGLTMGVGILDDEGKYTDRVPAYKGIYVKAADPVITADLKKSNRLFKAERIVHRYPYCYRCHTPLIQKAQDSWFVSISKLRDELLKNNEEINWVPEHLKTGRFKKGIETAPDWCISRTRFWASPLPVWQLVKDGKVVERVVIGSRDELREKAVQKITKITFVRHAERDKSEADGKLTSEGLKQAEALKERLKAENFDAVFSSDTNRSKQTAEPLADQLGMTAGIDTVFGTIEERAEFDKIAAELKQKFNVNNPSEVPEAELVKAYATLLDSVRTRLAVFLKDNSGKYLLVATHAERIAFIRHIVEGRNLSEALAMDVAYTGTVTMYFNGEILLDLHRPKIDAITVKGVKGELTRVPEVLDVWMDSASMPYASKHYPFERKIEFEQNYPADFVIEYIAQTRAWFYVMHVVSSALFKMPPFKNVLTTGVIFGTDGRKMSKSYGNYPDPKLVLEKYGAEPLRLYMMGSRVMMGEDINLDEDGIKDQLKTVILPLWNSYSFFVTYANLHNYQPAAGLVAHSHEPESAVSPDWDHIPFAKIGNKLDHWIIARLQLTLRNVRINMDEYNIPAAVREIPIFIDEMSKWYIRRSRDRFAAGDKAALDTLYYVLVELIKLMAPVTPFLTEDVYQNLVTSVLKEQPESIHLTEYPHLDLKFLENSEELLEQMQAVREAVNLGQALRAQNKIKVRQPLGTIQIMADIDKKRNYDLDKWMQDLISEELNVKDVDLVEEIGDVAGWARMKSEDKQIEISMDLNISEELRREGTVRELIRQVQNLRKEMGLKLGEKIKLAYATEDDELRIALDLLKAEFTQGVSADSVSLATTADKNWKSLDINNKQIYFNIEKS